MKKKKGIELPMNTIVIAAILIVAAIIIIFVFKYYYGKEVGIIGEQIDQLDDYDGDGTANMFDKCPCDDENKEGCDEAEKKKECKKEMEDYYKNKK